MKYHVTIGQEEFEIEVRSETEILFNGKSIRVDFQSLADQPVYSLLLDGTSRYEAYVGASERGLQVLLRGQLYEVDGRGRAAAAPAPGVRGAKVPPGGEFQLKAPMPGLIVAVPVAEGETVSRGQNLVILESMKMQNELQVRRATASFTASASKPASSVEQNQVLVTLA